MIIKKEMILRKIADENILVPTGETIKQNNGLFMLTETGGFIWEILPECGGEDEIVRKLTDEYDVASEQAEKDVSDFLAKLRSFDIID